MSNLYGIYKGSVVDNSDGEHRGRVVVQVPEVFGTASSNWCEPLWPTVYTPAIGEVVWVQFVAGDSARPVYFSMLAVTASVIKTGSIDLFSLGFDPLLDEPGSVQNVHISAGAVNTPQLAANLVLASIIKTANIGSRVEIGPNGIYLYNSSDTAVVGLPTDISESNPAFFKGALEASSLIVTGAASFLAAVGISSTSTVTLESGTANPVASPSAVVDWEHNAFAFDITALNAVFGTSLSESYAVSLSRDTNGKWIVVFKSSTEYSVGQFNDSGVLVDTPAILPTGGTVTSATRIGTNWFFMFQSAANADNYTIYKLPDSGIGAVNVGYTEVNSDPSTNPPVIGHDGTDVLIAEVDDVGGKYVVKKYSASTVTLSSTMNSTGVTPPNTPLKGVHRSNFDFGAERTLLAHETASGETALLNSGGAYQTNDKFANTDKTSDGMGWDGTNFWTMTNSILYKHTTITWTTESALWWLSYTWKDTNATGGTHETMQGPKRSFTMKKRARLLVTPAAIPGAGGTDDPDHAGIFLGRNATAPVRTAMWLQTDSLAGGVYLTTATFSGTNPPASNSFPTSTAGAINAATGAFAIDGFSNGSVGTGTFRDSVDARVTAVAPTLTMTSGSIGSGNFLNTVDARVTWSNLVPTQAKRMRRTRGTVQTCTTSTFTLITLGTSTYNTSDVVYNSGDFTMGTGYYLVNLHVPWASAGTTTGQRRIFVNVNNASLAAINDSSILVGQSIPAASQVQTQTCTATNVFTTGDVLRFWGWQSSGGNLDISFDDYGGVHVEITKIGT